MATIFVQDDNICQLVAKIKKYHFDLFLPFFLKVSSSNIHCQTCAIRSAINVQGARAKMGIFVEGQ